MLRRLIPVFVGLLCGLMLPVGARADEVVRFLHNETAPAALNFFKQAIAAFQKENPGITISMETINSDNRLKKIMASINTKTMPEIIKLNPEERFELSNKGYIIPLDDLIDSIGRSDFDPDSLVKLNGHNYDIPYTLGNYGTLWYRTDLLDQAG